MNLIEQIKADFMSAYKEKNFNKKNFLGVLIGMVETQEKNGIPSTDENVLKVIKTMNKGLGETMSANNKMAKNTDKEVFEISILKEYLPVEMSEDEITLLVINLMNRLGTDTATGILVGNFNKENKGKAFSNNLVGEVISKLKYA